MTPIPWLECRDAEAGSRALASMQAAIRDLPLPPNETFQRLGVTTDGAAWVRVDYPKLRTRPDPAGMLPATADLEPYPDIWGIMTAAQRAAWLWTKGEPQWHPLDEGLALLTADDGPRAELERRHRAIQAEETAEIVAAEERRRIGEEQRARADLWAERTQAWKALPRERQMFLAAAAQLPAYRDLLFALADIIGTRVDGTPAAINMPNWDWENRT